MTRPEKTTAAPTSSTMTSNDRAAQSSAGPLPKAVGTQSGEPRGASGRSSAQHSDIRRGTLLERALPHGIHPYLRLARIDRPIGTWLLLFPCWWGLALASAERGVFAHPWLLLIFAIGAVAMRGAGCTYNDIVDRRIDGAVARTATRPIPAGEVSLRQAWIFLGLLLLTGVVVLLQLNGFAIALGLASLLLVAAYPFMKRITYWPQAWLGLTFNWGALVGFAAVAGELALPALLLYAAGFFWTLGYDTIYAHQDKEDDALIGVKSLALRLGDGSRPWLAGFYAAALALMALAGWTAGLPAVYFLAVAAVGLQFAWQIATVDIDNHADCLTKFRSNRYAGALLFAGLLTAGA